ncbi:unnamed protein product [Spirodela intermedia]|uniref:Uncharacterized protein n=1 Tax=Spirodela intermedia TaxID=51605 RepID=A0A7I8LI57_SPIIN|nr:unnamed protein product [Spirodela intermedia]
MYLLLCLSLSHTHTWVHRSTIGQRIPTKITAGYGRGGDYRRRVEEAGGSAGAAPPPGVSAEAPCDGGGLEEWAYVSAAVRWS